MFARLLLIVLLPIAVAVAPAAAQVMTVEADARGIPTISPGGGNVGVGFAVPVNMARTVMDQLIRYGEVQRGRLGVLIQDLTPDLAEALGIDALNGAVVNAVEPDTPTARAGLEPGDVITAVNRQPVDTVRDLGRAIGDAPGTVALTVWRDGRLMLIVFRS